jgi:hypothetical protein
MRPLEIVKIVSLWAYELRFSDKLRVYFVQHVSLLELADEDSLSGQTDASLPSIEEDEKLEFQVEEILDSCLYYRKLRYLVRWIGYDKPTWEQAELVNDLEAVDRFHARHPLKPEPLSENLT